MTLIIDRYMLKAFLGAFLFTMLSLAIIFVIVNMIENLDKFIDSKANFFTIIKYYTYFLPEILKMMTPVAVLTSILFSLGKLSTNNEITAIKTGGMSLYRIMLPFIIVTLILSFFMLFFNGWIVPKANIHKIDIERQYLNKSPTTRSLINLYFRDTPQRNVFIQNYEPSEKRGINIYIDEYKSPDTIRIVKRIEAFNLTWNESINSWILKKGFIRNIDNQKIYLETFDSLPYNLEITHNQIKELKKSTDEMTYDQLKTIIDLEKKGGKDVRKQLIEYYGNYAFPFANLIVVLFAVPFSSIKRKSGIALQIASTMIISFVYLVSLKISQTIGFSLDLNPIFIGWFSNLLFLILGIFTILKTKT